MQSSAFQHVLELNRFRRYNLLMFLSIVPRRAPMGAAIMRQEVVIGFS